MDTAFVAIDTSGFENNDWNSRNGVVPGWNLDLLQRAELKMTLSWQDADLPYKVNNRKSGGFGTIIGKVDSCTLHVC